MMRKIINRMSRVILAVTGGVFFFTLPCVGSGRTVTIKVDTTGVYRLTPGQLNALGFDNAEKVEVVGFPAQMLSDNLFTSRPYTGGADALPHVPQAVDTHGNLVFHAVGPVSCSLTPDMACTVTRNTYSLTNHYLLRERKSGVPTANEIGPPPPTIRVATREEGISNSHYAVVLHEEELESPGQTGAFFFGRQIQKGQTVTESFDISGIVAGSSLRTRHDFVAKNKERTTLSGSADAAFTVIRRSALSAPATTENSRFYSMGYRGLELTAPAENVPSRLNINLSLNTSGIPTYAAIDRGICIFSRANRLSPERPYVEMYFDSGGAGANKPVSLITPSGSPAPEVWAYDSQGTAMRLNVILMQQGDLESTWLFTMDPEGEQANPAMTRVVAFMPDASWPEARIGAEARTGVTPESREVLIIAPELYMEGARELADIHRAHSGLDIGVYAVEDIFASYSSATPHAMALRLFSYDVRRLARAKGKELKAIILYGSGQWDNRGIIIPVADQLITYQVEDADMAADNTTNYCSDQYFGMLEEDFDFSALLSEPMSVPVGRLPVRDPSSASQINAKIKYLLDNPVPQHIATNLLVISDDGDGNSHLQQAEDIVRILTELQPATVTWKGHNMIYPWKNYLATELRKFIAGSLRSGTGLFYAAGHSDHFSFGAERFWTDRLSADTYYDYPPVAFIASCGTFDFDRRNNSIGEVMLTNPRGGMSVVIGTSRSVYMEYNHDLSRAFVRAYGAATPGQTIGDIFVQARNYVCANAYDPACKINTFCFNLMGDPLLPVAALSHRIGDVRISGEGRVSPPVGADPDSIYIRALAPVTVSGKVTGADGAPDSRFNGTVNVRILESPRTAMTMVRDGDPKGKVVPVELHHEVLAEASAKVAGGEFEVRLICPESLVAGGGNSIIISATSTDGTLRASGIADTVAVLADSGDKPLSQPSIESLYIDRPGNGDGSLTGPDLTVHALIDGGNCGLRMSTSGVGRGVSARLDGTEIESAAIRLSPEPAPGNDGHNTWHLTVALNGLSDGVHDLSLGVRTNDNAYTSALISFTVTSSGVLPPVEVVPVIASDPVTIRMAEAASTATLPAGIWTINITDPRGKTVRTLRHEGSAPLPCEWDMKDEQSQTVAPGHYRVRVSVMPEGGGTALTSAPAGFTWCPVNVSGQN